MQDPRSPLLQVWEPSLDDDRPKGGQYQEGDDDPEDQVDRIKAEFDEALQHRGAPFFGDRGAALVSR